MDSCAASDAGLLPEPLAGEARHLLNRDPSHCRRLVPPGIFSSACHAFFLSLAVMLTVVEPPESPMPIDTRDLGDEVVEKSFPVDFAPIKQFDSPPVWLVDMATLWKNAAPAFKDNLGPINRSPDADPLIIQPPESLVVVDLPPTPRVHTPQEVVDEMLKLAKVQANEIVMDLDTGDGRIPITAAKKYNAWGFGYDIYSAWIKDARDNARLAGVQARVAFEQRDLFKLDLRRADVVTLNAEPRLNDKLVPQLENMKPGARVVSHLYDIPGHKAAAVKIVRISGGDAHTIYLYVLPLQKEVDAVAGTVPAVPLLKGDGGTTGNDGPGSPPVVAAPKSRTLIGTVKSVNGKNITISSQGVEHSFPILPAVFVSALRDRWPARLASVHGGAGVEICVDNVSNQVTSIHIFTDIP